MSAILHYLGVFAGVHDYTESSVSVSETTATEDDVVGAKWYCLRLLLGKLTLRLIVSGHQLKLTLEGVELSVWWIAYENTLERGKVRVAVNPLGQRLGNILDLEVRLTVQILRFNVHEL